MSRDPICFDNLRPETAFDLNDSFSGNHDFRIPALKVIVK